MKHLKGHRKSSWALVIWTATFALFALFVLDLAVLAPQCSHAVDTASCLEGAGWALLALPGLGLLWLIGFVPLLLAWWLTGRRRG